MTATSETRSQIQDVLRRIPHADADAFTVAALEGGATNRNFLVTTAGFRWVLRMGGQNTNLLGISRDSERDSLAKVASLGLAPRVVYSDISDDIMVSDFVAGRVQTPVSLREPARLERVARALRSVHDGAAFQARFDAFAIVRNYHKLATERAVRLPLCANKVLTLAHEIEHALADRQTLKPCHNDLLSGNFIDDGARLWLLDWEYSGMGDPFFDLGNLSVNQELDEAQQQQLLLTYFGELRDADWAHLQLMTIVSDMREAWWGFVQSTLSTIDFDYTAYGQRHLERILKNAATPLFNGWLAQVKRHTELREYEQ